MAEYENNNQNMEGNNNINGNPSPNNKIPEYSFWAENAPGGSQTGTTNQYQTNQSSTYQNTSNSYSGEHQTGANTNSGYAYTNSSYTNNPYSNHQQVNNPYTNYSNAYANYNPNANNWSYGNNTSTTSDNKPKKERGPINKAMRFVLKAVCFGTIAVLSFFGFGQLYYVINPGAASSKLIDNLSTDASDDAKYEISYTSGGDIQREDKATVSGIVDQTMPAIVSINSTATQTSDWLGRPYSQEVEGSGSGFIVGKNETELLVATNNHVVEGTDKIKVTFIDGSQADAVIKGTDVKADLAVVSVDIATMEKATLDAIEVAKLGNSDEVKVGQMSIAIGNALGYGQSVTVGYISAKDREVEISDGYTSNKMILLQTDAAINPGNSGGALLNVNGEVIAINTVKYASNEVEGMGYAIPISRALPIINELMSREILSENEQGYLGIIGNDVTEDVASYYNMPIGVFINELAEGGSADKAGLLPGDIIIKADEIEITSITQLRDYVTSKRIGTDVTITYMRKSSSEYQEGTIKVTLGKNPNLDRSEE